MTVTELEIKNRLEVVTAAMNLVSCDLQLAETVCSTEAAREALAACERRLSELRLHKEQARLRIDTLRIRLLCPHPERFRTADELDGACGLCGICGQPGLSPPVACPAAETEVRREGADDGAQGV